MRRPRILLALALLAPAGAQARLELGRMWTFEEPPLAYLEREYGFAPTQQWLDRLRLATLKFDRGCSASFVSPQGLIMTNQHCVRGRLADASPAGADWVQDGFVARSIAEEVRLPGVTVQQLVAQRDVTAQIEQGIAADAEAEQAESQRRRNLRQLVERAQQETPELRAQVVRLHAGKVWRLYQYRSWDDVRLVVAPHLQAAHFGGDADNFTYPRWSLDFAFCRAYEGGRPADTSAHWLRFSRTGALEGDLVFVAGNPSATDRMLTEAQLRHLRDASYPLAREALDGRVAILASLSAAQPEQAAALRPMLLSMQNMQKAYAGYHAGLADARLIARKREDEAELRRRVGADPELARKYGDVWERLAANAAQQSALEPRLRFHNPAGMPHLGAALALVRAIDPGEEAEDKARLRHLALRELKLGPTDVPFLIDHLQRARRWLPKDDPFLVAALGTETPEAAVPAMLAKSRIADCEFRRDLLQAGAQAVQQSDDPFLRIARALAPLIEQNRRERDRLDDDERRLERRLAEARFAVGAGRLSPDATGTLRFSDGRVLGYPCNGTIAPSRTSLFGLFARHAEFDGRPPFDLPPVFLERRDRLDLACPLDLASTNDIIGGNSGSPLVDQELQVVGLVFDGNIDMLPNRFVHSDATARAVSVHVRAILEALRKLYDADWIADELTGSR